MAGSEPFTQHPLFLVLAVISAVLTVGYYWGSTVNRKRFEAAFDELAEVIKPEKKEYGNIGGTREFYCNFSLKKGSGLDRIDAKFTFLPRQLLPYLPIALYTDKFDTLLIALHFKEKLRDEGHIIESGYAGLWRAKIDDIEELQKAVVKWGRTECFVYYRSKKTYDRLKALIDSIDDPGSVKHIAMISGQKKCFVMMVPQKGRVAKDLTPVYRWLLALE